MRLSVRTIVPAAAHAAPTASADFDGDGAADLAVGAPFDSVAGRQHAGAVNVIYGSSSGGLRQYRDQQFTQGMRGVQAWVEADDRFRETPCRGRLYGDGHADLAVGSPGDDVAGDRTTGVVSVLYGSRRRLTVRDELFGQDSGGAPGTREPSRTPATRPHAA